MQSYLSGRGTDINLKENQDGSFRPFLQAPSNDPSVIATTNDESSTENQKSEVIYDEENCPKVEVVSEDGSPRKILIHLSDGRILSLDCQY